MNNTCDILGDYYDMVYKISFNRIRNYEDARDVCQDVFVKCIEHMDEFETEEHMKNWLIRVTINMIIKRQKSSWNKNTVYLSAEEEGFLENTTKQFSSNDKYFFDDDIEEILQTLPRNHQDILKMFYYSSMSIKEIAAHYCIKENTAKMRLSRARDILKDCLDTNGLLAKRLFTSLDSKLKTYFKEYEKLIKQNSKNLFELEDIKNVAVVVIDMANGWTNEGHPFSCDASEAVLETRKICDIARKYKNIPVIFFKTIYSDKQEIEFSLGEEKMPIDEIKENDYWSRIDNRLGVLENETVFTKNGMSCFCKKSFDKYLKSKNIDTLIVMGLTASGSVRYTVMDAFYKGYNVIVPKNTIADRIVGAVYWNMFDIEMNFARVLNKNEIFDVLYELENDFAEMTRN